MKDRDDRTATSLPVTAEVGGEGGSFADPTVQIASEKGQLDRTNSDGDSELASRPVRSESVSANAADDVKSGVAKHADE
jgi:hypothetical protein